MSENKTWCIDIACPMKDTCDMYAAEIRGGMRFNLYSSRFVDMCRDYKKKED